MDITKVQSSTTRGGLEIALTYDFTDCNVETLIPFIVAHLNTRYVQRLTPLEKGEKLTAEKLPEQLKAPIKVAELQMDAKGEVKKKKALETTTTTLKGMIEGLSKEEALAKLATLGITFQD